jgi:hypothetical protein
LITCGAWHGGEMVYTHRTGTGLVRGGWPKSPEKPAMAPKPVNDETGGGKWAFDALRSTEEQIRKVDDTTDFHIQFAGWTAALALVTLGLSIRALWLRPSVAGEEDLPGNDDDIAFAIAGHEKRAQTGAPPESVRVEAPARVPAARFWLLACLLGIVTALLGWMLVAPGSMAEATKLLKDYPRYMAQYCRREHRGADVDPGVGDAFRAAQSRAGRMFLAAAGDGAGGAGVAGDSALV